MALRREEWVGGRNGGEVGLVMFWSWSCWGIIYLPTTPWDVLCRWFSSRHCRRTRHLCSPSDWENLVCSSWSRVNNQRQAANDERQLKLWRRAPT